MFGTCLVLAFLAVIVIMLIMDECCPPKRHHMKRLNQNMDEIPHMSEKRRNDNDMGDDNDTMIDDYSKEDFNVVVNNHHRYGRYGGYGGYGYGRGSYGYPYYGYNSLWYPYGYNYDLYDGYSPYYRSWYSWFNPYNWWY